MSLRRHFITGALIVIGALSITACTSEKDNTPQPTPLVNFAPKAQAKLLWMKLVGSSSEADFVRMPPAVDNGIIYADSVDGFVIARNAYTGSAIWRDNFDMPFSTGPSIGPDNLFIGTSDAKVVALNKKDNKLSWVTSVSGQVLAKPVVSGDTVYVKTIDGKLTALNRTTGKILWSYSQDVPSLVLRGSSSPAVTGDDVLAGFANGKLVMLHAGQGSVVWNKALAVNTGSTDIEQMVDIDSTPVIDNGVVYAAAYQGNVSALNATDGSIIWQHDMSTFTGMSLQGKQLYLTDSQGYLWAFDKAGGVVDWLQKSLEYRHLTAPVVDGDNIVAADREGYVHWLNAEDGSFVARAFVGGEGVIARPVVADHIVYVMMQDGRLAAYKLG